MLEKRLVLSVGLGPRRLRQRMNTRSAPVGLVACGLSCILLKRPLLPELFSVGGEEFDASDRTAPCLHLSGKFHASLHKPMLSFGSAGMQRSEYNALGDTEGRKGLFVRTFQASACRLWDMVQRTSFLSLTNHHRDFVRMPAYVLG